VQLEQAERNKTNEECKRSEQIFRAIFDNAADGMLLADAESKQFYVGNNAICQMLGYAQQEIKNLGVLDIHPAEDLAYVMEQFEKQARRGSTLARDISVKRKDGSVFYADINSLPITFAGRAYLLGSFRDVTGRRKAEHALRESEEKYRTLLANIPGMVFRATPDWSVDFVSNSESICGYSPQEFYLQQVHWLDIIHPEDKQMVANEGSKLAHTSGSLVQEYRIITKSGDVRWIEDHKTSNFTEEGILVGIDGVVFDTTERKKAEERQVLRLQIVKIFQRQESLERTCKKIVSLLKGHLNCDVVALRMRGGDDYPYYTGDGFSQEFIKSENHLCARDEEGNCLTDSDGRPILACMCGIVVNSQFDRDKPFFTEEGSFWTNSTTALLASTTAEDRGGTTRNTCNQYGYESVALIPLKSSGDNIGLLQINAKMRNLFSLDEIQFLEELGHLIGIAVDRNKAEDKVRENEEKYHTLYESSRDGIASADMQGNITGANQAYLDMLGFTLKELNKLTYPEVTPARWHGLDEDLIENQLLPRGYSNEHEKEFIKKDGTVFPVSIRVWLITDAEGQPTGTWVIARDITESKRAERRLSAYRQKMVQAERLASLGTLIAMIAHKLSQPLTVINISLESALKRLEMTSSPETVARRRIKESLKQVSNIVAITDRFRNFARKSSEPIVIEIDLKTVAERIVGFLSENARRARIVLCVKDMDELPPVYWDMNDLEQLFFSLVDNAVRAADGKESQQLVISGVVENGHIELQFSDNCGGIAPENLDKVFDPFFTTRPVGQGTGLGLCIVQEIVSRARGKVRVESEFGEGSTFFITLPIHENKVS